MSLLLSGMNLPILGNSCKWNHTIVVLLCLASLFHSALWLQVSSVLEHISELNSLLRLKNITLYVNTMFGLFNILCTSTAKVLSQLGLVVTYLSVVGEREAQALHSGWCNK